MSILIKGLKMPKSCEVCPCNDDSWRCGLLGRFEDLEGYETNLDLEGRFPECPLVEIPPHGKLIDADVIEVRHGHWKILRPRSLRLDRRDSLFECSECGANKIRRTGEILNYCPNCGARMDGKEQENEVDSY